MSTAHAVAHGAFGRACLYELDRPMVPHAHREGHLIFHVRGPVASVVVDGKILPLTTQSATAISPWQPHYFAPVDRRQPTLTLVLYIRPGWFVEASHTAFEILRFGRSSVEMSDHITRLVMETARLLAGHGGCDGSFEDRLSALTQAAFDQTWQWTSAADRPAAQCSGLRDFRLRRAIGLLSERLGEPVDLAEISRSAGLSRPHFFSCFASRWVCPRRSSSTPCAWSARSTDWPEAGKRFLKWGLISVLRPRRASPGSSLPMASCRRAPTGAASRASHTEKEVLHRKEETFGLEKRRSGKDRPGTSI